MCRTTRPNRQAAVCGALPPWLGVTLMASVLSMATPGWAQETVGKWEIEFHGGGGLVNNPTDGTGNLPTAGPPFTSVVGTTSRRTSSWYFGDGAVLLNQVNAALGVAQAITPLDPVLKRSLADRRRGASFGFRVSRAISRRFSAEFTFDYAPGRLTMSPAALAGIEASRASFTSAWNALIANGPFLRSTVTSVSTIHDRDGKQTFTTGALNINLKTTGKVIPYATAGAGLIAKIGGTPSASLTGNYQFQTLGPFLFPVNETDTVTLRSSIDDSVAGVLGGGLKYFVSPRWGIRFDVRAFLNKASTATVVDTRPSVSVVTTQLPSGVTASFTTPSLQFSNNAAFGSSSLTGSPLTGFRSFSGSGLQSHMNVTAGVFLRF